MNRYEWEDRLVDAQTQGLISNGALLVALKLAKAINWKPRNGRPAGLYWKNDEAFASVGLGRSTFYKHQESLVETGFIEMCNGNVCPSIPESTVETPEQSTVETLNHQSEAQESTVETLESTPWTAKSTGDNTFSEDTFSEDTFSEDVCSEEVLSTTADAAVPTKSLKLEEEVLPAQGPVSIEVPLTSLNGVTPTKSSNVVKRTRQSTLETVVKQPGKPLCRPTEEQQRAIAEQVKRERDKMAMAAAIDEEW